LTTGATVGMSGMSYDTSNNAATFTFAGAPLSNGNYRATLKGSGVSDGTHTLAADVNFDFYVLSADANRDRKVDMLDFSILAARFGQTGQPFQRGNFDYDTGGNVDLIDFTYLASNFNNTLTQVTPSAAPAPGSTTASMLSRRLVDELSI
jgi:Dockerin type I domain